MKRAKVAAAAAAARWSFMQLPSFALRSLCRYALRGQAAHSHAIEACPTRRAALALRAAIAGTVCGADALCVVHCGQQLRFVHAR